MRRALAVSCFLLGWITVTVSAGQGEAKKDKGPEYKLTDEEKKFVELTNQERKKNDLPPLKISLTLSQVARAHSANMAKQQKMAHDLDGKSPFDRLRAAKYDYRDAGENVAYGERGITPQEIMTGWMDSKLHRANVLAKEYTEIGIGAVADKGGTTYFTQVFGTPR